MFSVVVPAFNSAATLPALLDALRAQTVPSSEFEVIVVDDGSTDDSARVALEAGARVLQPSHRGPAAARNLGVSQARADVILFTDADCEPERDWIEQMQTSLRDATVAGVKGAYATHQREWAPRLAQLEFEERYAKLEHSGFIDFVDTHSLALRKSALLDVGGYDALVLNNEDVDLSYRLASRGYRMVFNRQAVVYHHHPSALRRYLLQKFWRGYWRMQVYARHPNKMIADSYTPQSLKLQSALMPLLTALLPFVFIAPVMLWIVLSLSISLLLSALPLARIAWQKDRTVTLLVFAFVALRGFAIGCGSLLGVLTIVHVVPMLQRGAGQAAASVE